MAWGKSSAARLALFESLLADHPTVERRTMFGFPTGFANGNLFFGLFEDRFLLRFSERDHAAFVAESGAKFFEPMPGRTSRQTLVVPERVAADPALLRKWYKKALAHALSLPPKKAKKKAAKKK
jgi:TfoX/Sxy family transcriptional regulator of competence genes